jgi:site-specific DNA-methyltransferase (adenine-specific)
MEFIVGDCFEKMKDIPDKSVDMILTDPPYGLTKNSWDKEVPLDLLWIEYNRIIKDTGVIVVFSNQPFTSKLILSNEKNFKYTLVWEKNKFSDFLNAKKKILKIHEDICVFYKKTPSTYNPQYSYKTPYKKVNCSANTQIPQTNYNEYSEQSVIESKDGRRYPTSVLKFNRVERPKHPTQKPVPLLEYLIKTFTNENDVVLDTFAGVGSTFLACQNTSRKCICIELMENYVEIFNTQIQKNEINV